MHKAALGVLCTPAVLAVCLLAPVGGASAAGRPLRQAAGECTTTTASTTSTTTTTTLVTTTTAATSTTAATTTTVVIETTAPTTVVETQPTEGTIPEPVALLTPARSAERVGANLPRLIPAGPAGRARLPRQQADPCQPQVSASTSLAHTGATSRGVALAMGGVMLVVAGSSFTLARRRMVLPR